jgi:hypothetical protein
MLLEEDVLTQIVKDVNAILDENNGAFTLMAFVSDKYGNHVDRTRNKQTVHVLDRAMVKTRFKYQTPTFESLCDKIPPDQKLFPCTHYFYALVRTRLDTVFWEQYAGMIVMIDTQVLSASLYNSEKSLWICFQFTDYSSARIPLIPDGAFQDSPDFTQVNTDISRSSDDTPSPNFYQRYMKWLRTRKPSSEEEYENRSLLPSLVLPSLRFSFQTILNAILYIVHIIIE